MKISIETDALLSENEICIHVKKITEYVTKLVERISQIGAEHENAERDSGLPVNDGGAESRVWPGSSSFGFSQMITGRRGETVSFLKPGKIVRIYSLQKKVYAETVSGLANDGGETEVGSESGDYELTMRLYQIEEMMEDETSPFHRFIRVSNTDIVNFDYLENMDMSLNGNIVMNLTNGERVFVSRRYMKEIKAKLGIK